MANDRSLSLAHAGALAQVTGEFIRFGREGPALDGFPFGLDDIVASMGEALHFALGVEIPGMDPEDAEGARQLRAALDKWLSDNGFSLPEEGTAHG